MYCALCDRNVIILSDQTNTTETIISSTPNHLNPLQEHKYYCPYVCSYKIKDLAIQTIENHHQGEDLFLFDYNENNSRNKIKNDININDNKKNKTTSSQSQPASVPSGYLQYLEVVLLHAIGWKVTINYQSIIQSFISRVNTHFYFFNIFCCCL